MGKMEKMGKGCGIVEIVAYLYTKGYLNRFLILKSFVIRHSFTFHPLCHAAFPSPICRPKSVQFVSVPLPGARNGKIAGMR